MAVNEPGIVKRLLADVTKASVGKHPSYLVYSKYAVYEIQDMMFAGFFTSSDVYSAIEPGKTYRVYVMGRRIPFLSAYKNIVEVKPANEDNHGK